MSKDQVWAVMMCRDEADIILYTLRQLVNEGVDGIIVADNRSKDDTWHQVTRLAGQSKIPIIAMKDDEVGYEQSRKMTALANQAHSCGAEWIIPVDADELWYNRGDKLANHLRTLGDSIWVVQADLYNHFCTALDKELSNPFQRMLYRQDKPGALPKVTCRWREGLVIEMGNHEASYGSLRNGLDYTTMRTSVELRHFPYRSPEQMIRKARNGAEAYKATDMPESIGAHWRQYGALIDRYGEETFIKDVWDVYYHFGAPNGRWACARPRSVLSVWLVMTYGKEFFDFEIQSAREASAIMIPSIIEWTEAKSVIDVGCGGGSWLFEAQRLGCSIKGIDAYVEDQMLQIRPDQLERADLTAGYDCQGRDLAICLEVGEHLPESSAVALVAGLCKARYVLFSAAIPLQGGVGHVNEQWQSWWERRFLNNGYIGSCDIRERFWDDSRIEPYYLQNIVLYGRPNDMVGQGFSIATVTDVVHPRSWTYKIEVLTKEVENLVNLVKKGA